MSRRITTVLVVGLWFHLFPTEAWSQCGSGFQGFSSSNPLTRESVAVVFSGTVRGMQQTDAGQIFTFDVDRVWKGSVPAQIAIYRSRRLDEFGVGSPRSWVTGRRFIVLAHGLSTPQRAAFGLALAEESFGTSLCGDGTRPFEVSERSGELKELGPGYEPQ